jgi:hypothetical protein
VSTDNISRFPGSHRYRRPPSLEGVGLSEAEIAAAREEFLAKWQRALVNAEVALKHEVNLIIARGRA